MIQIANKSFRAIRALTAILFTNAAAAQEQPAEYKASIDAYVHKYVDTHEVVKGADRKHLHFFAPDSSYRVTATFERIDDPVGFSMPTSGTMLQRYYRYGKIRFAINGKECSLTIYQSRDLMKVDQYKNYLFLPFTDLTTGVDTYEGGRYVDLTTSDIRNNEVTVDFNKAYNPYCAYVTGYNCPLPPKENALSVSIKAGEQKYGKAH